MKRPMLIVVLTVNNCFECVTSIISVHENFLYIRTEQLLCSLLRSLKRISIRGA